MNDIEIRRPDDFHVHLRQGELLDAVLPLTARDFARGLVMPNTTPPICTADDAERYRKEILSTDKTGFKPLMTIKITERTTPDMVWRAADAGVIAGKLYPRGVTTNSQDGVEDFDKLRPALTAISSTGMVLCIHGEMPGEFCLDREDKFITEVLPAIVSDFPDLRVVLEHVSTEVGIEWVLEHQARVRVTRLAATITAHHLLLTLDDVVGDLLSPHHFCKPLAKRPADRSALVRAATSGNEAFFFGSDSAPHLRSAKECAEGCAGVFTAPVALSTLAEVFDEAQSLHQLEKFTSINGAKFYGLAPNTERLTLSRRPFAVPDSYSGIIPFRAGRTLSWSVLSSRGLR
jgi:dihydroorotase